MQEITPLAQETFTFYGISVAAVEQMSLHLVVLSFDRFSRDDIIGEVLCPLHDFDVVDKEVALRMSIMPRQLKVCLFTRTPLCNYYYGYVIM